jgi:hypothetical protein
VEINAVLLLVQLKDEIPLHLREYLSKEAAHQALMNWSGKNYPMDAVVEPVRPDCAFSPKFGVIAWKNYGNRNPGYAACCFAK